MVSKSINVKFSHYHILYYKPTTKFHGGYKAKFFTLAMFFVLCICKKKLWLVIYRNIYYYDIVNIDMRLSIAANTDAKFGGL